MIRDSTSRLRQGRRHPLVDTRTIGKAQTFFGEHKDWPDWSFQCTAYMGCANPKSIEAPRWAAMEETQIAAEALRTQRFEKPDPQLCFAFALFVMQRKRTGDRETHRDQQRLEAWRGLNAAYDSNNKGRQRVRMQGSLWPKRAEAVTQTTGTRTS